MSFLQLAVMTFASAVVLCAILALAWVVQQKIGSSRWVDATWTLSVGAVAFVLALWPLEQPWPHWRQVAVGIFAAAWCLRLGLHMAGRALSTKDDPRYHKLAVDWGADASRQMFWFLQSQAGVAVVLVMSIALAAQQRAPGVRIADVIGAALLLAGIVGEAIADRQLQAFRRQNGSGICDVGLWRWSRHPNYFFEWLGWVAYPVIAIDFSGFNPYGVLAFAAPACMFYILNYVSGIPPLEQHMLRTRGDAFRKHQKRTPAFFPFPLR